MHDLEIPSIQNLNPSLYSNYNPVIESQHVY